jgi:hypothetical protein
MHLELIVDDTAAFTQELHDFVENDRYPFSPRDPRADGDARQD